MIDSCVWYLLTGCGCPLCIVTRIPPSPCRAPCPTSCSRRHPGVSTFATVVFKPPRTHPATSSPMAHPSARTLLPPARYILPSRVTRSRTPHISLPFLFSTHTDSSPIPSTVPRTHHPVLLSLTSLFLPPHRTYQTGSRTRQRRRPGGARPGVGTLAT